MSPITVFDKMLAKYAAALFCIVWLLTPSSGEAMHIMEGFLPKEYVFYWFAAVIPFVLIGMYQVRKVLAAYPERKMLLGLAAAFVFVLSALKIPSVTGSSSHATGIGLSAVLFGPFISCVLSGIVLLFQALLLAHGGITTWGANNFSMGVAGSFTAWVLFSVARRFGAGDRVAIFLAACLGDWATYVVTAGQLSLAFPDAVGGISASFAKFLSIFAITQIPLAVSEGLLTVVVYNMLTKYADAGMITPWWNQGGRR